MNDRQAQVNSPSWYLITPATMAELEASRQIFREYAAGLGVDLCFQDFASELEKLPGDYAAPRGRLMLAVVGGEVAGCCALRPLNAADVVNAAEMKRLYVRPTFRGLGLGRHLAQTILSEACHLGYSSVLLDTLHELEAARALYRELGFKEIPPYYHNPVPNVHYLKLELGSTSTR